jgi:hypothetical protein
MCQQPAIVVLTLIGLSALCATVAAQEFEVVSVKRSTAIERGGGSSRLQPGGRFVMTNGPVRVLLGWAYGTPPDAEIIGAPDSPARSYRELRFRAGHASGGWGSPLYR